MEGEPEDYSGGRDLDALSSFVTKKSGVKSSIVKNVPAVTVLTAATFENDVLNSKKSALVEFFAPWCGHCKNLAPTYEKVAKTFVNDKNVSGQRTKPLTVESEVCCSDYSVQGSLSRL